METRFGFTQMTLQEFETWLFQQRVGRTILKVQQHHTYIPSYVHFNGSNHFERQRAMKNHHVHHNGWRDIGQHFTTFPDGTIMTGRSLELSPACITNQNAHSLCLEHLGNFDRGGDVMTPEQQNTIVGMTALLCKRFGLQVHAQSIVYHHWFRLDTGVRNNGAGGNKSCPGTQFFGGNKVADAEAHFFPLVQSHLAGAPIYPSLPQVLKYVTVTVPVLNIRTQPNAQSSRVTERPSVTLGAVLRVFEERSGWYKISQSQSHWVAGRFTTQVQRATVKASTLNVRSGAGVSFPKVGSVSQGEEVFITEIHNGWCKISMEDHWVSQAFLEFNR